MGHEEEAGDHPRRNPGRGNNTCDMCMFGSCRVPCGCDKGEHSSVRVMNPERCQGQSVLDSIGLILGTGYAEGS